MTSTVRYLGNLRTEAIHIKSGEKIITDAPTDNNGKGEAFSPTDLVATALASCMLTIMGISAKKHNIDIEGAEADVKKNMISNPRRIGSVEIVITMPAKGYSEKERKLLMSAAHSCPVSNSLYEGIEQLSIIWQDN